MFRLAGGTANYTYDEARATVRGYMCETEEIVPKSRFAGGFDAEQVPRFAYRTYDCVQATPGPELSDLDLLVIAGLNGRVDVRTFARLRSFGDRAASPLEHAHQQQADFREFTRGELGDVPDNESAGWWLGEAWKHGVATPRLDVARVHKVLHHKRPHLFPRWTTRRSSSSGPPPGLLAAVYGSSSTPNFRPTKSRSRNSSVMSR